MEVAACPYTDEQKLVHARCAAMLSEKWGVEVTVEYHRVVTFVSGPIDPDRITDIRREWAEAADRIRGR